jgi:hypothetical protein
MNQYKAAEYFMADDKFDDCLTSLTPTVCQLMGVPPPETTACSGLEHVAKAAGQIFGGKTVEKCLIFCPDAIGVHLWMHPELDFRQVLNAAPLQLPVRSVIPPKTPVCFASMFTGAPPEVHGIRRYERPVLSCDTMFDVLVRGNKRVAIVAVRDSSIDLIFRGRNLDYFSEPYDPDVRERTLQLVQQAEHDVIVAYQQEYDDTLHKTTPFSDACVRAAKNHLDAFAALAGAVRESWGQYRRALVFAPDHGAHIDPNSGHGDHGEDIPEDMHIFHCYGLDQPETSNAS